MADPSVQAATTRARQRLRNAGRARPFSGREILVSMGDEADEVVLVEAGVVKVILPTSTGSHVVAGLYGAGALLGELGVLYSQPRSAMVLGHRNGIAVHISGTAFRDMADRDRDVRALVDATHRQRLHDADRRQLAVASMDVMARVVAQLSEWAEHYGERVDGGVVVRGLSHRDLAGAVLASEKHVDSVLQHLRGAGVVRTGRLCFLLPDHVEAALRPPKSA